MCDQKEMITDVPLPEWIEEALNKRSTLHRITIEDYVLEIFTAHFEGRVFDASNIKKKGE